MAKKSAAHKDKNLALISIILGAMSFIYLFFTGIPAIILGILALKRKAGNQNQAKLGILFGVIGSLLIIPILIGLFYLFRMPFKEQAALSSSERAEMVAITDALKSYKKQHGSYPLCAEIDTPNTCQEWISFTGQHQGLAPYPVEFETDSYNVEDRAAGTVVYASRTTCFLNTPTDPGYLDDFDDSYVRANPDNYAAIVFFHNEGRACFPTNTDRR